LKSPGLQVNPQTPPGLQFGLEFAGAAQALPHWPQFLRIVKQIRTRAAAVSLVRWRATETVPTGFAAGTGIAASTAVWRVIRQIPTDAETRGQGVTRADSATATFGAGTNIPTAMARNRTRFSPPSGSNPERLSKSR